MTGPQRVRAARQPKTSLGCCGYQNGSLLPGFSFFPQRARLREFRNALGDLKCVAEPGARRHRGGVSVAPIAPPTGSVAHCSGREAPQP
jgi:hypothetical protein